MITSKCQHSNIVETKSTAKVSIFEEYSFGNSPTQEYL